MSSFENPVNLPIKVHEGCKGCGGIWRSRDFHEGQCSKCKRCLDCCGSKRVKFSCAWNYERDYGGMSLERMGKRITHDRHVKAGLEGYYRRLNGVARD